MTFAVSPAGVVRFDALASLLETRDVLEHIAEDATDTQATRTDPEQASWLAGYRQALKDLKDAHDLHTAAHPERTTP